MVPRREDLLAGPVIIVRVEGGGAHQLDGPFAARVLIEVKADRLDPAIQLPRQDRIQPREKVIAVLPMLPE